MDTKALRQKILDLAIRGKLVPQDPNDEPASVLLERIRAEKQQMVKDGKLKPKDIKNDTIIFVGEDNLHYEKFQDGTVKCIEDEIPFDVPEGWAWVRLATVLSLSSGKSIKVRQLTDEGEFSVYGGNGINGTYSDYNVDSDTIIIGRVGFYCGNVYKTSSKAWVTDNALIAAIKEKGIFDIDFLVAVLKYLDLGKTSVSTAQPVVSGKGILPLIVPVPPKIEQNRILKSYIQIMPVLDLIENNKEEVFSLISMTKSKILDLAIRGQLVPQDPNDEPASLLLERIRAEKEELIKAGKIKRDKKESIIFKGENNSYYRNRKGKLVIIDNELPMRIPNTWTWAMLPEIVFFQEGPGILKKDFREKGIPLIRISGLQTDAVSLDGCNYLDPEMVEKKWSHFKLDKGDVILCTSASIGKASIVGDEAVGSIPYTGQIRFKMSDAMDRDYFLYLAISNVYLNQVNAMKTGNCIQHYGPTHLQEVYVPLPPLTEQKRIVTSIKKYINLLDTIESSLV